MSLGVPRPSGATFPVWLHPRRPRPRSRSTTRVIRVSSSYWQTAAEPSAAAQRAPLAVRLATHGSEAAGFGDKKTRLLGLIWRLTDAR